MWVCSFCGMELDDSIESCPFGCGTSRADGKGGEAVAADSGVAMPPLSNADVGARDYGPSNAVPARENDGVEPRGRLADHRDPAAAQQAPLAKNGKSLLVLTEGRTGKQLRIDSIACVLGREGDYCPELFSEQVSRAHMEISYSDHVWQACHIGTNPSVLVMPNGRINMETGIAYPLHGGERIRMANQTFMVAVEVVEEAEEASMCAEGEQERPTGAESCRNVAPGTIECWCVTCPKCGTKYHVQDGDDRVRECSVCIDFVDRRNIGRVAPVFGQFREEELSDAHS